MSNELERFDPEVSSGRIAYEHLHRYAICAKFVEGKSVLDLACGTGYGTQVLAERASSVVGLDIDETAIDEANAKNSVANVTYVSGDAYELPFDDGHFDMVVANEMIEHVGDHDILLREVKRVLKSRGTFLVSTPNKSVYNRYKEPNLFHISEMERDEFADLLGEHFQSVKMIGQRIAILSAAFGLERRTARPNQEIAETLSGRKLTSGFEVKAAPLALRDPEYLLAVCSDSELDDVELPASIFFMPKDDLWLEHEKKFAWASNLHNEDEALRADLSSANQRHDDFRNRLASVHEETDRLREKIAESEAELRHSVRDRDDLTKKLIAAQNKADEDLLTTKRLLEAVGVKVNGQDQTSLVTGLFAFQRQLFSLETAHEELARLKKHQQRAENEWRVRLKQETDSLEQERRTAGELAEEVKRLEELTAQSEERVLSAERRSAMDHAASERMRADLQSAQSSLSAVQREARKTESQLSMTALVRKTLPSSNSRPGSRFQLFKRIRGTTPLFDAGYIATRRPDLAGLEWSAYLQNRSVFGIDTHPLFSGSHYLEQNPDVAADGANPLEHFLARGWREGRSPNPYFDCDWYLANNPDVLAAAINPLIHYIEFGYQEGRSPNPTFNGPQYLRENPDVAKDGMDPFLHWVGFGRHEGRRNPASLPAAINSMPRDITSREIDRGDVGPASGDSGEERAIGEDFWLPQTLRDFLVERHGEEWIPVFHSLFATMDQFKDRPDQFAASPAGKEMLRECKDLSAAAARQVGSLPDASIIIPVYNNFLDTILCVLSLLRTGSSRTFEIIVADDGSSDATKNKIAEIGGCVRYVRQPENLGFLKNCNAAAEHARGQAIVLLNNDTIVLPEWLDGLLAPLDLERVGMVGSKLLNWDGTLQEAGGIFWSDGSAWNFGRNGDARAPEFNYLKEIDYCSGASIAVPTRVWREVGGFDPAFTPAYCEDSDLAFRLRDAGYRTLYSPTSEVVHHEGRSHGTDVSSGIKAYQVANNIRLLERWRHVLEREHSENGQDVLRARDRSRDRLHVLVVDHYVPQWDKDAGSRTMYEFIRVLLQSGAAVTFWPDNLNYDVDYAPALQKMGVEVVHGWAFVDGFEKFIRERADLYDMVLLSRPHIAVKYFDAIRRHSKATIAYYGHDVHFKRVMAERVLNGLPEDDDYVRALRNQEIEVSNQSDVILYPSQDEADLMGSLINAEVKSLAVPAYRFDPADLEDARERLSRRKDASDPINLLFVGGFGHTPNVDAITWFVQEVLPEFQAMGHNVMLHIAGSKAGPEIEALQQSNVLLHGFVSDQKLLELYNETDVVVAPLRYGAGVKGKVIEALARGVPVVTTDTGGQGIPNPQRILFVANSAKHFAQAVIAASAGDEARNRARAGLDFIESDYSTDAMARVLLSAIPEHARMPD